MIERQHPRDLRARRRDRPGPRRFIAFGLALAALASGTGCGDQWPSRIAVRILERYRKVSGAKPLPASGMIQIRLSPGNGRSEPTGREEILWEPHRYRESVSSAGLTTIRGIESASGKAYFTDEDGVTRVASEPVLRELLTRSYFWRRAWLFEDRENTYVYLGPADDRTSSVRLKPEGGNPLVLSFSRADGRLLSLRSPRFNLDFASATGFRDVSDPEHPLSGEIHWTGLPTGPIPNPEVGGGRAHFAETSSAIPFEGHGGAPVVAARLSGRPVRLAIDAAADGPLRLTPVVASRLALRFAPDVLGRSIASGASLEVGTVVFPSLSVQASDAIPAGADAVAGACLFRESIVELDWTARILGLHDPARWVIPDGYFRIVTDDDGNRAVAILSRGKRELRLTEGSDLGEAAMWLAAGSAERLGLGNASEAKGLAWGPLPLPPLPMRIAPGFFPDWGDDGRLGFALLARFHVFIDMPRRWTYVKPIP